MHSLTVHRTVADKQTGTTRFYLFSAYKQTIKIPLSGKSLWAPSTPPTRPTEGFCRDSRRHVYATIYVVIVFYYYYYLFFLSKTFSWKRPTRERRSERTIDNKKPGRAASERLAPFPVRTRRRFLNVHLSLPRYRPIHAHARQSLILLSRVAVGNRDPRA